MSTTVVGANSYNATIQLPADGDDLTASSVSTGLEQLANRTRYLKELVAGTPAVAGYGVTRLRYVVSLANLAAIAEGSRVDQDIVRVSTYGLYVFTSGSTAASNSPWIIVPDVGSGRWIHILYTISAASISYSALAAINSSGKLLYPSIVPNRIVERGVYTSGGALGSSFQNTASASFVDITGSITITGAEALTGSTLYCRAVLPLLLAAGSVGEVRLVADYASSDHLLLGSHQQIIGQDTVRPLTPLHGWLDVSAVDETITVRAQALVSSGGGTMYFYHTFSMISDLVQA